MALRDYIEALEGERRKILMFSRELPLSVELITQVIEFRRREMARDECSYAVPVLEEFIPLKPSYWSSGSEESDMEADDKSKLRKPVAKVGGALHLFEKDNCLLRPAAAGTGEVLESSISTENIAPLRKRRRCWSPELHRKFLDALEQLGGSLSATPKQIRELMKVDRLTNDEVKSHLQKYRLHTRQPSTTTQSSGCISPQIPPQLILVGGIWSPPPDCAVMLTMAGKSSLPFNGTHSSAPSMPPVSGPPQQKQEKQHNQLNNFPSMPSHSYGDDNNIADSATKSDSYAFSSTSQSITLPFL